MARLADDVSCMEATQEIEKPPDAPSVEGRGGRKLHQKRAQMVCEAGDLAQKPRQRFARPRQRAIVRDQLGDLDGELEARRYRGCPARVRRGFVRPVERRVDLDSVQTRREACELRTVGGEPLAVDAWDVPAGRTDERPAQRIES